MYKVVVIEDEVRVCNLIVKLIDWNGLGLELAGVAYDGISAYEMIDQIVPDVVITDIRLPGMTGIDLIKKYAEEQRDAHPKFIIISGHKEFEYAQSALKYGAEDFLIKPVNQTELNNTLEKAIGKIDDTNKQCQAFSEIDEKLDYYRNLHRMLMLKTMVETPDGLKSLTPEEFSKRYGVEFAKPYVCSFIIRLFLEERTATTSTFFQEKICESVLCNVFVDYAVAKLQSGLICHVNLERFQFSEFRNNLALVKKEIDKLIYPYEFVSYVIAVGEEVLIAENGYIKTTRTAEYTANASIGAAAGAVVYYRNIPHRVSLLPVLKHPALENLLASAVERLDVPQFAAYLATFQQMAREVPDYTFGLYEAVEKLIDMVMSTLQKKYGAIYPVQKTWDRANCGLLNCRTEANLYALLEKAVLGIATDISGTVQQLENPTITCVKQYIEEHSAEKITLETAAEEVYLNPAYLAALFKKETGITFLDYLTTVRMDRAKVLLQNVKLNLTQITREIGYTDAKYFTKLFQKYTGIKPLEYRKLYINDLL